MNALCGRWSFLMLSAVVFSSASRVAANPSVENATASFAPLMLATSLPSKHAQATSKAANRALDADMVKAVLSQNLPKVRQLLTRSADPNARSADELKTPVLVSAASLGNLEITRLLIGKGADIEGGDAQENTPLMVAALNNRAEVIRLLLANGAKADGERSDQLTPLKTAAMMGKVEAVRALIAGGADINSCKNGSMSPLIAAVFMGNLDVVTALISAGANVNTRMTAGETAIIYAAKSTGKYNFYIVKALIDAGADVSVVTNDGKRPDETAAANNLNLISSALYQTYARDLKLFNLTAEAIRENKANTATSSTRMQKWEAIKNNIKEGANPRYTSSSNGITTLTNLVTALSPILSVLDDNDPTMKIILARSDLDAQTKNGAYTALHAAVDQSNVKVVSWLIKAGANLNLTDAQNRTPLDFAIQFKRQSIIPLLQSAGARRKQD